MREPPDQEGQPPEKNQAAAELGRKGGLKGGATRAARMTPAERSASARQAAAARWARAAGDGSNDNTPTARQRAKPFVFHLEQSEADWIKEAKGVGGQQTLHRR